MSIHTDAWGKLMEHIEHTGSTAQPYQFVGQMGYYTHWQDTYLGLLQLGVRFYDPQVGRFAQVDHAADGLNWYAYGGDLPNKVVDPTGMQAFSGDLSILPIDLIVDRFCDMWKCAHDMVKIATEEAKDTGAKAWKLDALKHCTGICKMAIHCPAGTAYLAYLHEWVIIYPPNWGACAMDFSNNGRGLYCARQIYSGHFNGSCLDCCLKLYERGDLIREPTFQIRKRPSGPGCRFTPPSEKPQIN